MEFSKKFVAEDTAYSTYQKNVPAPIFRKSFSVLEKADRAEILICGLGFYELFVNGKKITKGCLAPYISNSDHICYFDSYDILPYLNEGENVIGVMLGDGHQVGKTPVWDFKYNKFNSPPLLALTLEVEGENMHIHYEADDFLCKKGPVLFNDLRSGIFYDARLEEEGWCAPGFIEKDWHKPICGIYKPRGYAKMCDVAPVKVIKELKPVSITKGGLAPYTASGHYSECPEDSFAFETHAEQTGGFIYDFGENNAGLLRLKISGTSGQKVSLQCGEQVRDGNLDVSNIHFYPDGFSQREIYYLKGNGEEMYESMFTYHGFRYVYVSGISEEQATEDLLTYLVISSIDEERGTFECSDAVANKLFEMGKRSDSSNFVYFPTDCPHREKNGWTGDASASAEHMIMTSNPESFWREWLNNIRCAQKESGMLPGIVPTDEWGYEWGNGPAWDSVLFTLPYMAFKYRGETDMINENAGAMIRYLEYISKRRDENGIVAVGLGDWLPIVRNDGGRGSDVSLGFTDSVMVMDMCRKGKEMFDAVGLNIHRDFAEKLEGEMKTAIRNKYVNPETLVVDNRYQSAQAMAIFYDVFEKEEKEKAFQVLMDIIHEDNDNFTCGFLGIRVLFHVLSEFGEAELAYRMITKPDYPSYGYWLEKGETTFLECFFEYGDYYHQSKNHHFFGDILNWFISSPGGIKVQNSKEVVIQPDFIKALENCHASHKLPGGSVDVAWSRNSDGIELNIKVCGDVKYSVEIKNTDEKVNVIS